MKRELNAKNALIVVLLYLVISLLASLVFAIFSGGVSTSQGEINIDGVIDSGMYATIAVMIILLIVSVFVFNANTRDIYFERKRFSLSKLYYLFPLIWFGVTLFALLNVDYSSYSINVILLVLVASLAIGVNEELVTRGMLLIGLRNSGFAEWKAWLITVLVFSLLHVINVLGGEGVIVVFYVITGGTLLYVSRRVFNNLFVPIGLHALYDVAFFLLPGSYAVGENLPDHVLDIQFGSFLVLLAASILFVIFGRGLLEDETTGWQQ